MTRPAGTEADEAVRERDERYRHYFELGLIGMAITSPGKGRIEVNEQLCEMLGYSQSELLRKNWAEMTHPDDLPADVASFDRVMKGEIDGYTLDKRWIAKDGRVVHSIVSVKALRRPDGSVDHFMALAQDITERKRAEQALRESEAALKEADRRKDEFLATLAHELRNPLAPLRHGLQIMRLARGNAEILDQAREMMERQVGHMAALVDDLIDLNRISRGEISIHKERVDVASVVGSALDTCETAIRRSRQELTVALPPEPVYVYADRVRLAQVMSNLLSNACKYTDPGGSISLAVEAERGTVQMSVKDTGIGIPGHMLSRVFDMFTQVDGDTERAQRGLGIGLTIVKRLIEMHGGTVEARSAGRGMGSEFIVRLPLFFSRIESRDVDEPSASAPVARHRILVVDDNEDVALGLAMMLKLMGNDTRLAHSGREALDAGEAFGPDVILMDIGMPGLSGYGAAQRVRETVWGKRARLVAVTGWGQEKDRLASAQAGFDEHLVKPVEPRDLESLLASLAAERNARRQAPAGR
jgi:PAS domain S-box-containing protein